MKRPRPHIPLSVRVKVAERQYFGEIVDVPREGGLKVWLAFLIKRLGKGEPMQLDHDPALIIRSFNRGKYYPDANDPEFLVYRLKDDHLQKTTGRKPGAARTVTTKGSDIGVKTKFARLARPRRQKQKIPARKNPWPKRSMRA